VQNYNVIFECVSRPGHPKLSVHVKASSEAEAKELGKRDVLLIKQYAKSTHKYQFYKCELLNAGQ